MIECCLPLVLLPSFKSTGSEADEYRICSTVPSTASFSHTPSPDMQTSYKIHTFSTNRALDCPSSALASPELGESSRTESPLAYDGYDQHAGIQHAGRS
nr:hypothetical protein CFP56_69068 [Quercus suber]